MYIFYHIFDFFYIYNLKKFLFKKDIINIALTYI